MRRSISNVTVLRRGLLFLCTLIICAILPNMTYGFGDYPWPYHMMPSSAVSALQYIRKWIAIPAVWATLAFWDLHFISVAVPFPVKKNRFLGIVFCVLAAILILPLFYWTLGYLTNLPIWPLPTNLWVTVFIKTHIYLCLWWVAAAACIHFALEYLSLERQEERG